MGSVLSLSLDIGHGFAFVDGASLRGTHLDEASCKACIYRFHLSPTGADVTKEFASLVGASYVGC